MSDNNNEGSSGMGLGGIGVQQGGLGIYRPPAGPSTLERVGNCGKVMGTSFAMGGCLGITIGTCMATIQAGADYAAGRKMNITQHMKATSRLTISSGVMFGVFLGASAIFRGC